jgi:dTMP kinase
MNNKGLLVVFEGLDRSGKSTQIRKLTDKIDNVDILVGHRRRIITMPFPIRTTPIGELINRHLKGDDISPQVAHLLFSANRWEAKNTIQDILDNGDVLILDRYTDSGIAYSMAKGLAKEWCTHCDLGLPVPDLVIYLDLSEEEQSRRMDADVEIYERSEFQNQVRKAYGELRDDRWVILDADQPADLLHERIVGLLQSRIREAF